MSGHHPWSELRRALPDELTATASLEEADHVGLAEGDPVWFTGYAPDPPLRCAVTQVLTLPAGHPHAGTVTGYVLAVDGGGTLCAEPDQLKRRRHRS